MHNTYWPHYQHIRNALEKTFPSLAHHWFLYSSHWVELLIQLISQYKKLSPLKKKVLLVTQGLSIDQKLKNILTTIGLNPIDEKSFIEFDSQALGQLTEYGVILLPRELWLLGDYFDWSFLKGHKLPLLKYSLLPGFIEQDVLGLDDYETQLSLIGPYSVALLGSRLEFKPWWEWEWSIKPKDHWPPLWTQRHLLSVTEAQKLNLPFAGELLSGHYSRLVSGHFLWRSSARRRNESLGSLSWRDGYLLFQPVSDSFNLLDETEWKRVWSPVLFELQNVSLQELWLGIFTLSLS